MKFKTTRRHRTTKQPRKYKIHYILLLDGGGVGDGARVALLPCRDNKFILLPHKNSAWPTLYKSIYMFGGGGLWGFAVHQEVSVYEYTIFLCASRGLATHRPHKLSEKSPRHRRRTNFHMQEKRAFRILHFCSPPPHQEDILTREIYHFKRIHQPDKVYDSLNL